MKQLTTLMLAVMALFFTSCQFTENIYINPDGSGKVSLDFDASSIMQMAGDEISEEGEKAIDSVFSFKEVLKEKQDSIAQLSKAEQERLKKMEKFSMRMQMDPAEKTMMFNMFADFKNVGEIEDLFSAMNNAQQFSDKAGANGTPLSDAFSGETTATSYSYKGNVFKRISKVTNKELQAQYLDSLGEMKMMLASSNYKLNYHFPKKIKTVSREDVMFSEDRKSMTLTMNFIEYLSNPEGLNVEVELED
ncbi:hypothetical protein [Mangrovimonas aestuarii]|uniref:hypothetical protein n=1 Tax=Mangrovimonas aestuarii TaxID=3018443 RepID=UPI002379807C|nr:hypothetical protein [Mangrovimonas aestuarii]